MPPQDKIEKQAEGEGGAVGAKAADNLTGSRCVDGKTVQVVQKLNPNRRDSMSDIPMPGTSGNPGSNSGFCITDGSQVIASKEVYGVPATVGPDGQTYLQGHISNVPEVSQGVTSLEDLDQLANGIGIGLVNVAGETLNYLRKPNAVSDSLISIGPTLDRAWDYYTEMPANQIGHDAEDALTAAWNALEDTLGHPLTPEQRGDHAGVAMTAFIPVGGSRALTAREIESVGGAERLGQLTDGELEALGRERKLAGAGGEWPTINERPSPDVVKQSEKMSCVSACGEMLSEGTLDQAKLIERLGAPCDMRALADALGPRWKGEGVGPEQLDKLLARGPWAAELREPAASRYRRLEPGHTVVVDGADKLGNIQIRDPAEGTRYEMTREDFEKYWSGYSVFRY